MNERQQELQQMMEALDAMWSQWQSDAERQQARASMAALLRLQAEAH